MAVLRVNLFKRHINHGPSHCCSPARDQMSTHVLGRRSWPTLPARETFYCCTQELAGIAVMNCAVHGGVLVLVFAGHANSHSLRVNHDTGQSDATIYRR